MRLDGRQLVLDTNIWVHFGRGGAAGQLLEREYGISQRRPRAVIPVVVKGELFSLARQWSWGGEKIAALTEFVAGLPTIDISHDAIVKTYAEIDASGVKAGVNLGQNDVWIAAVTRVLQGVLLTTDRDFQRLGAGQIELEFVDPVNLKGGSL